MVDILPALCVVSREEGVRVNSTPRPAPALLEPAFLGEGGDPGGTDPPTCTLSVTLGLLSSPCKFIHLQQTP